MTFVPTPCTPSGLPGRTLLRLPAELDMGTAPELYDHILALALAQRPRLLVLDLTGTHFMDSQGAHLVEGISRALRPDTEVRVAALPDGLPGRVLTLTGVRRDVPLYDDAREALTS
ncbi:STAS domain-containing protein [Streptomyces sp. J2-1]|uniref:STAS domain-containing protein n=1 Tax=Streptomyces corallincola TaxID=2851888 RepID=UPI001C387DC6|nr:STAS domain-containing protein [Streptomyces corallincola]MBV2356875.1 STAS domain-containing protein [Streptomyces corallincola]